MWKCPTCGFENPAAAVCPQCHYDPSRDYTRYPTVDRIPESASGPNFSLSVNPSECCSQEGSLDLQGTPYEAVRDPSLTTSVQETEPTEASATVCTFSQQPDPVQELKAESPRSKQRKKPFHTILFTAVIGLLSLAVLWAGIAIGSGNQPDTPTDGKTIAAPTVPTEETKPAETIPKETIPAVHVMAAAVADEYKPFFNAERDPFFWGQTTYKRSEVKTVTFQNTLSSAPGNAWDVSDAGDKSILAWMNGGNLCVAANGKIAPNSDASYMFAHFENLEKIDFGDCFDTANVTDMRRMFQGCGRLTEVDVSSFDTANVTDMGCMFLDCSSLKNLDVSGFDTANVTIMGSMFSGCSGLTSLDVSRFDTANVTNMGAMFYECNGLTSLDVSRFVTSNVTDMGSMFSGCSSLTSLDLSRFVTSNVTNMWNMFMGCSSLTSLDLSSFNTANVTNMGWMFDECSGLTSLVVSGFHTANVTDMSFMFNGCSGLTSLDLSSFDTANVTDMRWMFDECSSLTDLKCSDSKILAEYSKR